MIFYTQVPLSGKITDGKQSIDLAYDTRYMAWIFSAVSNCGGRGQSVNEGLKKCRMEFIHIVCI